MRSISKLVASRTPRKTKQYYILTTFSQASKKDSLITIAEGQREEREKGADTLMSSGVGIREGLKI